MQKDKTDILIIGAGPAGLFAAFYAGMRDLTVNIIDSLPEVGGQPKALYPEKNIFDIAGFPKITGSELIEQLIEQLKRFHETTSIHLDEEVIKVEKEADGFKVETTKTIHYAKSVLIAAGNGSFHPRKVELDNLADYEGRGIEYFISDAKHYLGKTVAICGGGDSAFDMALGLREYAEKIYIVHRRDSFRAHEHSVKVAKATENIEFITPYVPVSVDGDGVKLTHINLQKARKDDIKTITIDNILMAYGFASSIGQIKDWGLKLDNNMVAVDHGMQSSEPGIFAIGDIATYPGKTKLIASGFGEAPAAINGIVHFIYPERQVNPLHSSTMFEE